MSLNPVKTFLKPMVDILQRSLNRLSRHATTVVSGLGRTVGIVCLGVLVPNLTGLLGTITSDTALYWLGYEYCIGISFVVWQGNRLIWLQERKLRRRFPSPILKPILLVLANLLFTLPITVLLCLGWFAVAEWQVRWDVVKDVVFCNMIASCFLTFFYEAVVLSRKRERDLVHIEQLERATIQAELEALKLQLDPHFIFNSLNTLSHLIETHPAEALEFNDNLAEVYRYMLAHRSKTLVPLGDELALLQSYYTLLRLRFRGTVQLVVQSTVQSDDYAIMPVALQLLLENAVKHNEFDEYKPLMVEVFIDNDFVSMRNARRPKRTMKASIRSFSGAGLNNLDERSKLITKQRIAIVETKEQFFVRIPIVYQPKNR